MQDINAWLNNNGDFETGKALYIRYGKNSFFKKTLETFGATPYNIKQLGAELKALAPVPPASIDDPKNNIEVPAQARPNLDEPVPPGPDPKDVERYLSLKLLRQNKYRQLDHNRAALSISLDKHFRHLTAKQILYLHNQIIDIYTLTDFYEEHGKFPSLQVQDDVMLSPSDELQKLWISNWKARKRLSKPGCRKPEKTRQLILDNDQRIAELMGKAEI